MAAITDVIVQNNLSDRILIDQNLLTDMPGMLVLVAQIGAGPNSYATPRKMGDSSGYSPGSSLRGKFTGAYIVNNSGSPCNVGIMSADTDVGFASTSAPTNPDVSGQSNQLNVAASTDEFRDLALIINEGEFAHVYADQDCIVYLFGKEDTVS